jgi:hypothetical protein
MVLEYVQSNPRCNRSDVKKAMPFSPPTTDKILKKLIQQDEKIIYEIDKVNPRIHHLLINDKDKLAILNSRLRPMMTCAQLTDGRWACVPTSTQANMAKARLLPNVDPTVLDTVIKLLAGTKWHDNHPQIINLS